MPVVRRSLCLAVLLLFAVAGCGLLSAGPRPAPPPTTAVPSPAPATTAAPTTAAPTTAAPSTPVTSVTGRATDTAGTPVAGVVLGFRSTASPTSCTSCLRTVATGVDGTYSMQLEPDSYGVACVSTVGACAVGSSSAGGSATVTVESERTTLDVHVSAAPRPTPTPQPTHTNEPAPPAASSFSGKVTLTDGRPIRGVTIEFKAVPTCESCAQPWVKSDASGHYSIDLPAGVYNALCVLESFDYECGPRGGDGNPHPVQVPPSGQHLDFIVCPLRRYPACLS